MAIDQLHGFDASECERGSAAGLDQRPLSSLAALLDRFTDSVENPEAHTIGAFAETVGALHAELAMLARHFEAVADRSAAAPSSIIDAPTADDAAAIDALFREQERI